MSVSDCSRRCDMCSECIRGAVGTPVRRYLVIGKRRYFRLWEADAHRHRIVRGTCVLADWETELLTRRRWWRVISW